LPTPPLPTLSRSRWTLLGPVIAAAVVFVLSLVLWLVRSRGWPWGTTAVLALIALLIAVGVAYWQVMTRGAKPFPAAPNSDLPSVLKALYLQQKFGRFAIDNQAADPRRLHEAFGRFFAEHQPKDLDRPTQAPGVIKA